MARTNHRLRNNSPPPASKQAHNSEPTEEQAAKIKKRKFKREWASKHYCERQGQAYRSKNAARMAKKRAEMSEEEKRAEKEKRKESAASLYLRNRNNILRKAQNQRIGAFVEKTGNKEASWFYPYRRHCYTIGEGAGEHTEEPRLYF
ncbi:hypothetical protein BDP27DRAFT_1431557 [Rhodocollybia butyracea]|uniref:Uncharacterized protein n=1 Tax=Rhodocollybia butyracea TaxID=206335 RepID=A0A9P5P6Q8_9AGAR|nr:hypothetical protein BDP27DRAFT_1431557 [Rhodocollybia butyracea]